MTQSFRYPNLVAGTRASYGAIAYDVARAQRPAPGHRLLGRCGLSE